MMPGSGLSSTTLGTPKRSTRTSMRHQSRQPSARYASSATRSVSRQSDSVTPVGVHWKIASGCSGASQIHLASYPYTGGAPRGSGAKSNATIVKLLTSPLLPRMATVRSRPGTERGDVRCTTGAVQPLGHVEDDVGTCERKFLREEFVGLESNHGAEETESLVGRIARRWVIPFCVGVRRVVCVRLFVVCETYSHSKSEYEMVSRCAREKIRLYGR